MAGFFKKLKEKMFDKKSDKEWLKELEETEASKAKEEPKPASEGPRKETAVDQRQPYFVQIGLDFGTSFTKVVCRDINISKAWIHMPEKTCNKEVPFLISSSLCFEGETLSHPKNIDAAYLANSLAHVKMALQSIGLDDLNSSHLLPYKNTLPKGMELGTFVECCAVYLLAGVIGETRNKIAEHFPGQVEGDQTMVNMAVPVASANDHRVEALFERILHLAWHLSDEFAGHPECLASEIADHIKASEHRLKSGDAKELCFIYPEVSANVQGFIRSRSSNPGLYLFSDTGAGTVDQSLFRFSRKDTGEEFLTYLSAQVLNLGSSRIEELAQEYSGKTDWKALEDFRRLKESGSHDPHINRARQKIHSELGSRSKQTIAIAKKKLTLKKSINELRVIFGGGGHCTNPYKVSVMQQFDTDIFRKDQITERRRSEPEFDRGMPDLRTEFNLKQGQERWSRRLSVAYGLSFIHEDLAPFKLPKDVEDAKEEEIIRNKAVTAYAPTMDDC